MTMEADATESKPDVQYASFWRRLVASFIDGLIPTFLSLLPMGIAIATLMLYAFLYYPLFESSSYQATPGKMVMGIIVTDSDGQRITFARALVRSMCMNLAINTVIGALMIFWTQRKQGLHDKIANCVVVRKQK